jgi:hypothetical protein
VSERQAAVGARPAFPPTSRIAVVCLAASAAGLVAVHALDPRSIADPLSFFSVGRFGALYGVALGAFGCACAAIAAGASLRLERLLWLLATIGALAAALAPSRGTTVTTARDQVHLLGMALLLVGGASALGVSAARRWVAIAAAAAVALSILLKITHSAMLGGSQRLTLALLLVGTFSAVVGRQACRPIAR